MSHLHKLYLTVLTMLALTSCDHKELCYDHLHTAKVNVIFDWQYSPDANPKTMTLYLFDTETGADDRYDFTNVTGGEITVFANTYNALCFNSETDNIRFSITDTADDNAPAGSNFVITTGSTELLSRLNTISTKAAMRAPRASGSEEQRVALEPDCIWTDNLHDVSLISAAYILLATALCACSENVDSDDDGEVPTGKEMSFDVTNNGWTVKSRDAAADDDDDEADVSSFGLLAYCADAWSESLTPNYIYNAEITSSQNYKTGYGWPKSGNLWFMAYAPYNADGFTMPTKTDAGTPKITYSMPTTTDGNADLTKTVDLLATFTGPHAMTADNAPVPLTFEHKMAAIRLVSGELNGSIRVHSITFKNIYTQGDYSFADDSWDCSNYQRTDATYQISATGAGGNVVNYTDTEASFFPDGIDKIYLVPQTLPSDATIEIVTGKDNREEYLIKYTINIGGAELKAGAVTTFKITCLKLRYPTFRLDVEIDGRTSNLKLLTFPIDGSTLKGTLTAYVFTSSTSSNQIQSSWMYNPTYVKRVYSVSSIPNDAVGSPINIFYSTGDNPPDWFKITNIVTTDNGITTADLEITRKPNDDEAQNFDLGISATLKCAYNCLSTSTKTNIGVQ